MLEVEIKKSTYGTTTTVVHGRQVAPTERTA